MTDQNNTREIILDILTEILEKDGYSHVVLFQALNKYQYLSKQDRSMITRITEGTLEYLIQIDWVLNRYSKTKVTKMKPVIRTILRMSVYQILYMDRVPDSAACNEAVKLTIKRKFVGLKGFVNGVLRTVSREKERVLLGIDSPSVQYSVPDWLYEMWKRELGEAETKRVCQAFLTDRPTMVRCNEHLASREEILESLRTQCKQAEPSIYSESMLMISGYDYLESLTAFQNGWIQVQDLSSSFVGLAADPKEGNVIIDVCAAPGGKSIHLADLLKGTGHVYARDLTEKKAQLIDQNIDRCGFSNLSAEVMDAKVLDPASVELADIVLADLPCSGLGIIGKKPDIKLHVTEESMESLVKLQREILSVVWQYVKPGGTLVYSTCTIHSGENKENRDWFLSQFPFEPVDLTGKLGQAVREDSLKEGWIQFLPGSYPCDGFFLSVMRRKKELPS